MGLRPSYSQSRASIPAFWGRDKKRLGVRLVLLGIAGSRSRPVTKNYGEVVTHSESFSSTEQAF
jgi:hypothetical protein